jgi:1,4-alpha-glucan branching enzyme
MLKKGRKKGTIRFTLSGYGKARSASLAGDFTGWKPVRMRKQKGSFAVTVPVRRGAHQYKFLVDDQWVPDPDSDSYVMSPIGTVNSLATVE